MLSKQLWGYDMSRRRAHYDVNVMCKSRFGANEPDVKCMYYVMILLLIRFP